MNYLKLNDEVTIKIIINDEFKIRSQFKITEELLQELKNCRNIFEDDDFIILSLHFNNICDKLEEGQINI